MFLNEVAKSVRLGFPGLQQSDSTIDLVQHKLISAPVSKCSLPIPAPGPTGPPSASVFGNRFTVASGLLGLEAWLLPHEGVQSPSPGDSREGPLQGLWVPAGSVALCSPVRASPRGSMSRGYTSLPAVPPGSPADTPPQAAPQSLS